MGTGDSCGVIPGNTVTQCFCVLTKSVFPAKSRSSLLLSGGNPLNGSTTTVRRSSNPDLRGFRSFMWMSMLMSLGVVFFGMQLMMVGPLKGRLDSIQTRLDLSESSMNKLVAVRESVFRTNDLLTSLAEQSSQLQGLKDSIESIQTLNTTVRKEAKSADAAMVALNQITSIQSRLIGTEQQTLQAASRLNSIEELQKAIIDGTESTEVAANSLEGLVALQNRLIASSNNYEQASKGIANLADLTQRMVAQSDEVALAAQKFDEFVGLKNAVTAVATDLELAQSSVAGLGALKNELIASSENLPVAEETARTLVALNDRLSGQMPKLDSAQKNLESLLVLQDSLSNQSNRVVEAIQNLEIMDDFRTEVDAHVKSLVSLRRTLMDIAMMESTLGRVAQVIEPLIQISNLRRLGDEEIREAARVILDRRMTRFSQTESKTESGNSAQMKDEELIPSADEAGVPLPPEARN